MAGSINKVYDIRETSEYSRLQNYTTYKPTEVGTFSISEDGDFFNCNKAKIPTLRKFKLPLNLNEGYNPDAVDEYSSKWEEVLMWIHDNKDGYNSISDVDVITKRGVLKDIGYTNHNFFRNPWKLEACRYAGKLYIRKFDEQENLGAWGNQNTYWGMKFEEHVVEQEPGIKATYQMLKGKIGSRKILLGAEVDAITEDGKYLEIKTCFADKLAAKILQAWLQSYLGNVDVLMFGWKERSGIVSEKPVGYSMKGIPGSGLLKVTDANAMIGFIGDVIDWMYTTLPDGNKTWLLEYTGGRQISLKCSREKFLPGWYVQFVDGSTTTCSAKEHDLVKQVEALTLE